MKAIEYLLDMELPEVTEWLPELPAGTPEENDAWIAREIADRRASGRPLSGFSPVNAAFVMD